MPDRGPVNTMAGARTLSHGTPAISGADLALYLSWRAPPVALLPDAGLGAAGSSVAAVHDWLSRNVPPDLPG